VSGGCFVMGQAAGTGAALALAHDTNVRSIDTRALQRQLQADGAFIGSSSER